MKGLTLRQLRYFDALARHGHFGRAAEASAISQPALSVQIRELEDALGTPLFERTARKVRLTGFGEGALSRARDILRAVEELGDLARAQGDGIVGRLRVGVIPTIAPYLLPAILGRLTREFPDIDIHVRETITSRLIQELSEGSLDTAVVALPISEPSLEEVPLFDEAMLFVAPIGDKRQVSPTPASLSEMRLLLLEEGHCFREQALSFCNFSTNRPRDGLDGSTLSTLVQMVGAGMGVTLIPEMAAKVEARSAPVAVTQFAEPRPHRTIGLVWRASSPLADQLSAIADMVKEVGLVAQAKSRE